MLVTAIADIAAGQRGFIARAQAVTAGADDDDLRRAVRSGWLERAGHGLYRVAGVGVRANDETYAAWLRLEPRRDARRVADDLPVQEPADAAAWILDHGEGDPAHVGQLMQEAIATGFADPGEAAQALAPVARRWNVHVGTLLGDTRGCGLHGAFTFHCCRWDMIAWLASQPSGNLTGTFRWTGSVEDRKSVV